MKKLFIFDLDGTLVDSYFAIQKSLNATMKKFNLPEVNFETVKRSIGHGDKNFITRFARPGQVEELLAFFKEQHEKDVLEYVRPMPHCHKMLSSLKQRQKKLAIATNRPSHSALLIIEKLGLDKFFNMIVCSDEVRHIKPHPLILQTIMGRLKYKPDETVYVGDMRLDIQTAMHAKVKPVYVKGGSSNLHEIPSHWGKSIINHLAEMHQFIR